VESVSVSSRSELILVLDCVCSEAIPCLFCLEISLPHPAHYIDTVLEIAVVSYFVERLGEGFVSLNC
jgi:hypothetical protein